MTSLSNDQYLKVGDLTEWLGVSRSAIYIWVKEGHFPKPVVLGPHTDKNSTTRWLRSEVEEWLANRPRGKVDDE
jgi:prophage regulatory protein